METREKIINGAGRLFFEYGIKSITMDDIAKSLTMSKKTLYQYYATKEELVSSFLVHIQKEYENQLWELANTSNDIIEELVKLTQFLKDKVASINPVFVYDMRKYFPASYKIFVDFKWSFIAKFTSQTIERGIKEGIFRKNLNPEIIARMRVEQVEMAFNTEIFPKEKYDPQDVHIQLFEHFIYGLCTPEGYNKIMESKHIQESV